MSGCGGSRVIFRAGDRLGSSFSFSLFFVLLIGRRLLGRSGGIEAPGGVCACPSSSGIGLMLTRIGRPHFGTVRSDILSITGAFGSGPKDASCSLMNWSSKRIWRSIYRGRDLYSTKKPSHTPGHVLSARYWLFPEKCANIRRSRTRYETTFRASKVGLAQLWLELDQRNQIHAGWISSLEYILLLMNDDENVQRILTDHQENLWVVRSSGQPPWAGQVWPHSGWVLDVAGYIGEFLEVDCRYNLGQYAGSVCSALWDRSGKTYRGLDSLVDGWEWIVCE